MDRKNTKVKLSRKQLLGIGGIVLVMLLIITTWWALKETEETVIKHAGDTIKVESLSNSYQIAYIDEIGAIHGIGNNSGKDAKFIAYNANEFLQTYNLYNNVQDKIHAEIVDGNNVAIHIGNYGTDSGAFFWIPDSNTGIYITCENDANKENLNKIIDNVKFTLIDSTDDWESDPVIATEDLREEEPKPSEDPDIVFEDKTDRLEEYTVKPKTEGYFLEDGTWVETDNGFKNFPDYVGTWLQNGETQKDRNVNKIVDSDKNALYSVNGYIDVDIHSNIDDEIRTYLDGNGEDTIEGFSIENDTTIRVGGVDFNLLSGVKHKGYTNKYWAIDDRGTSVLKIYKADFSVMTEEEVIDAIKNIMD